MRFAASRCKPARIYAHDQMTAIMQPFHCDLQPQIQDTNRTTHTGPTTCFRTQRRNTVADETSAAATAARRRYLSSPAEGTLHEKTQGFVLRLPPQHKPHATVMQPLQCVSQHHVANLHVSMHMATRDDNNHAAIPLRSATTDSRHACKYAQEQPLAAEHRGGTHTQRRNTFADETTAAATAAHTRYLSSPAEGTLHEKTQGFVLRLPPQHKPHATVMQPLQSHHFPKSPLPFVTLPKVTTLPLSPPFFVTTSLSLTPPFINVNSCVMYCYVMSSLTPPFINVSSV